jgi:hypothetical protein
LTGRTLDTDDERIKQHGVTMLRLDHESVAAAGGKDRNGNEDCPRNGGGRAFTACSRHVGVVMFLVRYVTTAYADQTVTLRDSVDRWDVDISGVYQDGAWQFQLDEARYPERFRFKFSLARLRRRSLRSPDRVGPAQCQGSAVTDG